MNDDTILRLLSYKRDQHPELRAPLTWEGFRRVVARESLMLAEAPLNRPAKLIGFEGMWLILLDRRRPARHLWYGIHELAHYWLHVEGHAIGQYEHCYNMDDFEGDDPREREAEFMVECMLMGPEAF